MRTDRVRAQRVELVVDLDAGILGVRFNLTDYDAVGALDQPPGCSIQPGDGVDPDRTVLRERRAVPTRLECQPLRTAGRRRQVDAPQVSIERIGSLTNPVVNGS